MTIRFASLAVLLCLAGAAVPAPAAQGEELHFDGSTFRVIGWEGVSRVNTLSPEDRARILTVYVDAPNGDSSAPLPAVLGSDGVEGGEFVFVPRYAPSPGVSYRVVFDPGAAGLSGSLSVATFEVPRPQTTPTFVEHVYPSTDALPENQLKLYIHFSAPMARGEAYRNIQLLNEEGREVEQAFLELEQELWTRDFRRFTILFDPGRIKSGLVPNLQLGPVLVPGNTYTLVIGSAWRDATGRGLKSEYRKTFRVDPFDNIAPNQSTWRVEAPRAGTRNPVAVEFPEPLDRALMDRLLVVVDHEGRTLEGRIEVDREETRWLFIPDGLWEPGDYEVVVGTELEDLAGNALNGLFEVDTLEVVEPEEVGETVSLPFAVPAR